MNFKQDAALALGYARSSSEPDGSDFKVDGVAPTAEQLTAIETKAAEIEAARPALLLRISAKKYLDDTDWYDTRSINGKDTPSDIQALRAQARIDACEE